MSCPKGYNEFVLYGEYMYYDEIKLGASYYYFYTAMSWDNGENGVLEEEGAGRGLFFGNTSTDIVEGWYCDREPSNYFNWECHSTKIHYSNWHPEVGEMPDNRSSTSWWECGVEDKRTYTQAQCRQ